MNSEEGSVTENSSSHLERGERGKSCDFLHSGMISMSGEWKRVQNGQISLEDLVRFYFSWEKRDWP